ncbi:MAG TPA: AMP-binding protein, partial [Chitinophagaceae bacterium]|nr:AMP-binding protein [Chitinophagaceae bacterium]
MTESILDLKALKANRNIAARTYWKNRMAGVVFKSYFGHYAQGNAVPEGIETFTGAASAMSLLAMAPAAKAQYVVLLAVLGVLTHKYARVNDVVILSPSFSGDGIIPVRMQNIGGSSFRELLMTLKEQLAQDMRHADYPLEKKLGDSICKTGMMLKGLVEFDTSALDILFSFSVRETLNIEIRANRRQCNEHLDLLPKVYFGLLEQLLAEPGKKIADVEMGKAPVYNVQSNVSLIEYWDQAVRNNPTAFRRLNEDANKLARYLRDKGVQPDQAVGVLLERSTAYITGILAVLKAGAIIVPVDPSYDDDTISTLIKGLACVISREDILLKRDIKLFSAQICIDKHKPAIDKYSADDLNIPVSETLFIQYSTRQGTEPTGNARSTADFMTELQWRWKNHPCPPGVKCGQRTSLRNSDHLFDIFGALLQGNMPVILNENDPLNDIFCINDNIYVNAEAGIIAAGRSKSFTPIKNVFILDNDGHHLPAGVPGEIWVNGKETGDIGIWLPRGEFQLLGNIEDEVLIGNYLTRLPVVEDGVVVAGENGEEKYLVVYYSSEVQPQLTGLPVKYPVYYVKMDEFPRTSRGKVDRTLLPEPVTREEEKYVAPSNEWEEKLVDTWAELLKLEKQDISV